MKKMKVCHVTSSHPRYDGRIFQKECVSLANKYEVTLLCSDTQDDEIKNNVNIVSLGIDNKNRKNRFFVIPKLLKKKALELNCNIYHLHDPELLSLAAYLKRKGKIVIFDSHEDNVERINNRTWIPKIFRPLVKKYYFNKEKQVLSKLDAVISVTSNIVDRLKKYNSNTYMITNYPIYQDIKLARKKKNNQLCFAGTFEHQYSHENIINALDGLNVKYVIAGKYNEKYLDSLKKLHNFNKVTVLGRVSKDECNKLYLDSNIGMVLIKYVPNINYKHGSLGITKIFEYMQYGLPVIASDLDVWQDIVPNKCGICVNPDDENEIHNAIKFLIDNPDIAKKMGIEGQKLVKEKYNWETQEKVLFKIYNKIERELKSEKK